MAEGENKTWKKGKGEAEHLSYIKAVGLEEYQVVKRGTGRKFSGRKLNFFFKVGMGRGRI